MTAYVIPVAATLGGALLLMEQITTGMLGGMALIILGIAIINRYESLGDRQVPLVVSISEDGKTWTEVYRSEENLPVWEIDLAKTKPKAAWVRISRDGEKKDCFHLRSIRVWGKKLF